MAVGKQHAAQLRRRAKSRAKRSHLSLSARLAAVERLIQQGSLPQAYQQLQELNNEYPRRTDILLLLAAVCRKAYVKDYQDVCLQLVELDASNREAVLMLAECASAKSTSHPRAGRVSNVPRAMAG